MYLSHRRFYCSLSKSVRLGFINNVSLKPCLYPIMNRLHGTQFSAWTKSTPLWMSAPPMSQKDSYFIVNSSSRVAILHNGCTYTWDTDNLLAISWMYLTHNGTLKNPLLIHSCYSILICDWSMLLKTSCMLFIADPCSVTPNWSMIVVME